MKKTTNPIIQELHKQSFKLKKCLIISSLSAWTWNMCDFNAKFCCVFFFQKWNEASRYTYSKEKKREREAHFKLNEQKKEWKARGEFRFVFFSKNDIIYVWLHYYIVFILLLLLLLEMNRIASHRINERERILLIFFFRRNILIYEKQKKLLQVIIEYIVFHNRLVFLNIF